MVLSMSLLLFDRQFRHLSRDELLVLRRVSGRTRARRKHLVVIVARAGLM